MTIPRLDFHNHSHYSNIRLLDATNRPRELVDRAIELGLVGIGITEHESLGSHIELDRLQDEYREKYPDFKIVRGNEIYLTEDRSTGQQYYHHILLALDAVGHKMLRELSSQSWMQSYYDRGMERVPTLYSEVEAVIQKYGQGHIYSSSSCLGSFLDKKILELTQAEAYGDTEGERQAHRDIVRFLKWCINTYGENNFSLEVQPARSEEQLIVNKRMKSIAQAFGLPICVTCDSHYLRKEDRFIHKALLNSKDGDREVDSFYEYCYLQSEDEIRENLAGTGLDYEELCANSIKIYDRCEYYTLHRNQHIVEVPVLDYPREPENEHKYDAEKYPTLDKLMHSDNPQERYWINYCQEELDKKGLSNETYLNRLEYEADIMDYVGQRLDTCIFAYPNFLQHYIDMIWEVGSPIGVARGSAAAGLNHWLLNVTGIDPIKHHFAYWRFLNKERVELPDIDIDISPTLRPKVFENIRKERGPLGCVQICTYGTISTKAAIKIACRGYRSPDYPDGIPLEEAEYMSSMIPQERGFLWSLSDCFFGNQEKGRKPSLNFINLVHQYDQLQDILLGIEGLISQRGIHASGVGFYNNEDPYEEACFMKAKDGSIITQWSLHPQEYAGTTKIDILVTQQIDIMAQCIQLLQKNGKIESELTLRQAYDKYVSPEALPMMDDELWDAVDSTNVLALFQLVSQVGSQTVKKLLPRDIETLNDCNGIMRLMADDSGESPTDRYVRIMNHPEQWDEEMTDYGLTQKEQDTIKKYVRNGVLIDQETLMRIVMDKNVCNFSLSDSNSLRRCVAKKHMDEIPLQRQKILDSAISPAMGKYIWFLLQPSMGYSFK